jgi:hypothetical protein
LASGIAFAGNPDLAKVPGYEPLGSCIELVEDCIASKKKRILQAQKRS